MNGQKEVGFLLVQISKGIGNMEARPFEIQTNGTHFVKHHFEIQTKISGFQMVGTFKMDHLKYYFQKFWILNVSSF